MIGKLPEIGGNNIGPALDRFEADYGFHGAAWCGIFVGHALQAAGLQVPHSVASVASILDLAQSGSGPFEKGILPVSAIRPGDLVTFGGTEHVAIVTSVDAQGIHTIAGNTGQSNVSETLYSPGDVTGVVRPKYAAGLVDARVMPAVAPASAIAPGRPGASALPVTPGAAPVSASAQAEAAVSAQNVQAAGAAPAPATAQFRAAGPKPGPAAHPTARFMAALQPQAAPAPAPSPARSRQRRDRTPSVPWQASRRAPQTPAAAVPAAVRRQASGRGKWRTSSPGPGGYPGDGAPKSAIARWMADEAQRRGLPRELPVMAALVESDLHNDVGGDRDSVGYFQMRTSIWDSGPYAGYTHNPELQLKWFLDQAVALKNDATTDPSQYGNWIADVERPAEQYRGRYSCTSTRRASCSAAASRRRDARTTAGGQRHRAERARGGRGRDDRALPRVSRARLLLAPADSRPRRCRIPRARPRHARVRRQLGTRGGRARTTCSLCKDLCGLLDSIGGAVGDLRRPRLGSQRGLAARGDPSRAGTGGRGPERPVRARTPAPAIPILRRQLGEDFYIVWFQAPGVADEVFCPRRAAHADGHGAPGALTGPNRPTRDPRPSEWMSEEDLGVYVEAFSRTGFTGGLNWYRNIDRDWELTEPFAQRRVHQPAMFLTGERDRGPQLHAGRGDGWLGHRSAGPTSSFRRGRPLGPAAGRLRSSTPRCWTS